MSAAGADDQSSTGRALPSALLAVARRVATVARTRFWQGLTALLVISFLLVIVRPFARIADPEAEDVAVAWNRSIARLGILPVFPPEEDFHVGDVWAVINEAKGGELKPLLGKSVRLAHIDLRDEIK